MKKADLKPGDVVAVRTYHEFARKAVIVAANGYVDVGYNWKKVIQPTSRPNIKTPKVAIAAEHFYGWGDERNVPSWVPELVAPQQIMCPWEEYERREEEQRQLQAERGRQIRLAREARTRQGEELMTLIREAGYDNRIKSWDLNGEQLKVSYAVAIEIFTELVDYSRALDALSTDNQRT